MNEQDFDRLMESVKQAGEIKRGQRQPSRVFTFTPLDQETVTRAWATHLNGKPTDQKDN